MKITEEYNANNKVWFCGKRQLVDKFYKPSPSNQMFFTTNPEYALAYMTTRYNNSTKSCCIVVTMNQFKLKVFDFADRNHVRKLNYPKGIEDILLQDSFWQSINAMYNDCYEYKEADQESIAWYQTKFKELLSNEQDSLAVHGNKIRYKYQAIIIRDIMNLPDKFTAYYNWDYGDDELPGGEAISLFNVDAIEKVCPTVLSFDDTRQLVEAVKRKELDLNNLSKVKDFIAACTGKYI